MSDNQIIPGDKIGIIEEYESGKNTFEDGHNVRSTTVGNTDIDKKNRIAQVQRLSSLGIPEVDDIVVGTVAAVMSSMIAVSINYVNNVRTKSNVECICGTRHFRKKNIALVNDIVVLRIVAHKNGTIHASIDDPELGILYTKCKKCGGKVIPMRDAIKCTDCNWIDERKLSNNFGKNNFVKLGE